MDTFRSNRETYIKILKSKFFIATIISMTLILAFGIMALNKTIIINQNGQQMEVQTFATSVKSVLETQGIEINENDYISPDINTRLKNGDEIIIRNAFEVKLIDGGKEDSIFTIGKTVEDVLKGEEIELEELDIVEPGLEESVSDGTEITVTRILKDVLYETYEVPYKTVTEYTEELDHGKTRKVQDGATGTKENKYEVVFKDGLETERTLIEENLVESPVDEIIEKGTSGFVLTSRGENRRYSEVLVMEATAYTAGYESTGKRPGDPHYGVTRSGTRVRPGVVAVDPNVIPLGSRLYIESMDGRVSYGVAYAEDTGGAIRGNKIDIYYENVSEALRFGRRNLRVYVLK